MSFCLSVLQLLRRFSTHLSWPSYYKMTISLYMRESQGGNPIGKALVSTMWIFSLSLISKQVTFSDPMKSFSIRMLFCWRFVSIPFSLCSKTLSLIMSFCMWLMFRSMSPVSNFWRLISPRQKQIWHFYPPFALQLHLILTFSP